jgi:hypothetical protein
MVDVNALNPDDQWVDLDTDGTVTGWSAVAARDVNDCGQVVGDASDGVITRAFLFDPLTACFYLLPTTGIDNGRFQAFHVNENGDILIRVVVNGDYSAASQYLWTAVNPSEIYQVGRGMTAGLNNDKFLIHDESSYTASLYSYTVVADGTPLKQLIVTVPAREDISDLNDAGWFAYRENVSDYGRIKICRPGSSTVTACNVPGALHGVKCAASISNSGDLVFSVSHEPFLYRFSAGKSIRLYDLLDDNAKAVLFPGGVFASAAGLVLPHVNSSNVADVPASDSYDHIAGGVCMDPNHPTFRTTILLTPVPK